jgi:hypothetical protein
MKVRDNCADLDIDRRMILKCMLKKVGVIFGTKLN